MPRLEIVDYLRSYAGGALELIAHKRADEAADEITRLRTELAAEKEQGWKAHAANLSLEEDNDALREENARLVDILDDVLAQWDGDWPEELYARVKAAIREAGKEG